ncbi:MAG: hypothetical protein E7031_02110 [Akkermansiaceae bacterium]|nr:hypothetical protein [Akkermansiaceae bacterium]
MYFCACFLFLYGYYTGSMGEKRKKIAGLKWDKLPTGVTREKKRKKYVILAQWTENGERKRKTFPDTEDGVKAAKELIASRKKELNDYGQKFGAISDDEKRALDLWRDYVKACQKEACRYLPCSEVMQIALEQVRPQSITPLFPAMANEYLRSKENENLDKEHLRKIAGKVRRFSEYFADDRAGNITPERVQTFLDTLTGRAGGKPAPRTVQDYMVCLSELFSYGVKRDIVKKNPLDAMDKPQVKSETEPETITTEDTQKILAFACSYTACQPYLPALLLALFCGVRPAELGRMKYKDLFPGGRAEAYLSRAITKTNVDRIAKIRPNLAAWLNYTAKSGLHGAPDDFILPGETEKKRSENYTRHLKRVATGAGVTIPRDALRHTAATMICALDGMADAAEELGNDIKTLQKHYRHAVTKDEAFAFFSIMPPED